MKTSKVKFNKLLWFLILEYIVVLAGSCYIVSHWFLMSEGFLKIVTCAILSAVVYMIINPFTMWLLTMVTESKSHELISKENNSKWSNPFSRKYREQRYRMLQDDYWQTSPEEEEAIIKFTDELMRSFMANTPWREKLGDIKFIFHDTAKGVADRYYDDESLQNLKEYARIEVVICFYNLICLPLLRNNLDYEEFNEVVSVIEDEIIFSSIQHNMSNEGLVLSSVLSIERQQKLLQDRRYFYSSFGSSQFQSFLKTDSDYVVKMAYLIIKSPFMKQDDLDFMSIEDERFKFLFERTFTVKTQLEKFWSNLTEQFSIGENDLGFTLGFEKV